METVTLFHAIIILLAIAGIAVAIVMIGTNWKDRDKNDEN
jgi:hypothetical protein